MMRKKHGPQTVVVDYDNAKERDKGIQQMAKKGYVVTNTVARPGTFKKGKMLLTGGVGAFLLPGGAQRPERYTVTFQKQGGPVGRQCRHCGAVMAPDARFCGTCGQAFA